MTESELILLHSKLRNAKNYLEYGSGKSTEYAASLDTLDLITSVESDQQFWSERVAINEDVSTSLKSDKLVVIFPDLGETGDWGVPVNDDFKFLWPNYSLSAHNERSYDLVLVDGRFRVACILASILALPDCDILVHDFWQRKKYHVVLKYCDVTEEADTMVCLRMKSGANKSSIAQTLSKYLYNPVDSTRIQRGIRDLSMKILGRERTLKLIQNKKK